MLGFKFLGNTNVPHRKHTAELAAVRMPAPSEILLPLSQHIGAPATPVVKVGDTVKVGDKVAEAMSAVCSPIYSSVSGKVVKLENYLRPDGRTVQAIRIASDGEMTVRDGITPPTVTDLDSLILAVRESGVVGLGGAGFPTAVKLEAVKSGSIDTVIINGAECEPYITCDTRTMIDEIDWIRKGLDLFIKHLSGVQKYIFGIEQNKPQCIKAVKDATEDLGDTVKVITLPSAYPQGAEKVLIYNTTRRVVPEGKLPANVGVIVINVTSLAAIAKYVETGMPLTERTVTVDGSAVVEPKNVIAPIGASLRSVLDFAGGVTEDVGKVLLGGPMMGIPASSLDEPITKTTGAITALRECDSVKADATACIHCGRCVAACPLSLNPTAFSKALNIESAEDKAARLNETRVNICMECGCCSYVCPANRPLVQNNRLAKAFLRDYNAHMSDKK